MRWQLNVVGRDRPGTRVIAARDANEREARGRHHPKPDSIARKKKRSVQPCCLLRYRMRHPRKDRASAEVQSKKKKKSDPQEWREGFAEAVQRRTAPLRLRQVERRGCDDSALRDAEEEQQIDEIGLPRDRGSASD